MTEIRTRFAPAPTGYLHIGGARTALFSWLYARHTGGTFVLRIEDTDAVRSTHASTEQILNAMQWLGLDWDEGPFYQSERLDLYRARVQRLVEEGRAFWCECTPEELERKRTQALAEKRNPKYDGTCRHKGLGPAPGRVVRFLSEDAGTTFFDDVIKGRIAVSNDELDDLVLIRADGMPTYNLTVVIDDAEMGITHVIRGDDHVNNTPRQIQLYEALGYPLPVFAHVPMILGPDKTRLSKRHGATSVMAYKDMGFLPEAVVNYLVRLSWSHGDQEIFSLDELKVLFDLADVGRSAAVFNPDKMLWLNHHYIMNGDPQRLAVLLGEFVSGAGYALPEKDYLARVVVDIKERTKTLRDMLEFGDFYFGYREPPADLRQKFLVPEMRGVFEALIEVLGHTDFADKQQLEDAFREVLERGDLPFKKLAQPLRVALTGKKASPGIFEVIFTLGRQEVLARLSKACAFMGEEA